MKEPQVTTYTLGELIQSTVFTQVPCNSCG